MARANVLAVVVAGVFLAVALSVSAQDSALTFSDVVTSSDSAVPLVTYAPSTPTLPPSTTPPSSLPPTVSPAPAPPASPPPSPPASPPPAPPATPPSPPPVSAPVAPLISPVSSPAGSCPADYTKNFLDTFLVSSDSEHVIVGSDGDSAEMILNQYQTPAFGSYDTFYTGRFSVYLKLPCGNSSGTVFAFYLSSNGSLPDHDEIDIEILGNTTDLTYTMQTNIFINGYGNREERHLLEWFEPCQDFHEYYIHWNPYFTVIGVDDVPLRVYLNRISENKGIPYFDKGQKLVLTYWDGSGWATQGGKYRIDYQLNGPFHAQLQGIPSGIQACVVPWERDVTNCENPSPTPCWDEPTGLTSQQQASMDSINSQYRSYYYCDDTTRFATTGFPPDCQS